MIKLLNNVSPVFFAILPPIFFKNISPEHFFLLEERKIKSLKFSNFFFVHPNLSQNVPSQFPLWFITWYL